MSEKPKQTIYHRDGVTLFERDGKVVMQLKLTSSSDRALIEARWIEGAGMGQIAQALEALGYKP